jgi:hypothetical protein
MEQSWQDTVQKGVCLDTINARTGYNYGKKVLAISRMTIYCHIAGSCTFVFCAGLVKNQAITVHYEYSVNLQP